MHTQPLLVVDDHPDNRAVLAVALEHRGYEVLQAESGDEALRMARELRPAAVLLDIHMPGMDGWGTVARLKADPVTRSIPVVAVSAEDFRGAEGPLRRAGFVSYAHKPVPLRELYELIERVLAAAPGTPWIGQDPPLPIPPS